MYSLATTEPFNTVHHGKTNDSTPFIENYCLIDEVIDCDEFMQQEYDNSEVDIVEIVELPGQEHVAIFKTIWLKLLQRKIRRQCIENKSSEALMP
tara:strand:+ start:291 stop:575 length:285 start_codon:yes stop_codon:yes gene_type:complete